MSDEQRTVHFPLTVGKCDLAKAKKDLSAKDEQIARLKEQIAKLQAERASIVQSHKQEFAKLRNGYQTGIDKAVKEAESLRKTLDAKDARIAWQEKHRQEEVLIKFPIVLCLQ